MYCPKNRCFYSTWHGKGRTPNGWDTKNRVTVWPGDSLQSCASTLYQSVCLRLPKAKYQDTMACVRRALHVIYMYMIHVLSADCVHEWRCWLTACSKVETTVFGNSDLTTTSMVGRAPVFTTIWTIWVLDPVLALFILGSWLSFFLVVVPSVVYTLFAPACHLDAQKQKHKIRRMSAELKEGDRGMSVT